MQRLMLIHVVIQEDGIIIHKVIVFIVVVKHQDMLILVVEVVVIMLVEVDMVQEVIHQNLIIVIY